MSSQEALLLERYRKGIRDFSDMDLSNLDLAGCSLRAAVFRDAVLSFVDFRGADLEGVDFRGAALWGSMLQDASLKGSVFAGATLAAAYLSGLQLGGIDMSGTNLAGSHLVDATLANAVLVGANLDRAWLIGADLTGARLAGATMREAHMERAVLAETDSSGARMDRAILDSSDLRRARLRRASLRDADLRRADLRGADLRQASLEGAKLDDAKLDGALIDGASFYGAVLGSSCLEAAIGRPNNDRLPGLGYDEDYKNAHLDEQRRGIDFTVSVAARIANGPLAARLVVVPEAPDLERMSPSAHTYSTSAKPAIWRDGLGLSVYCRAIGLQVDQGVTTFWMDGSRTVVELGLVVPEEPCPSTGTLDFVVWCDDLTIARFPRLELGKAAMMNSEPIEVTRSAFRSIFACYVPEDRLRVLERARAMKARLGIDIFLDCIGLRASQRWQDRVRERLQETDAFFLFWSKSASECPLVEWEWRMASTLMPPHTFCLYPLDPFELAPLPSDLRTADLCYD